MVANVIILNHLKYNPSDEVGARKQVGQFCQQLIERGLLPVRPIIFCSGQHLAHMTALALAEGRSGLVCAVEELCPDDTTWIQARLETDTADMQELIAGVLEGTSQYQGQAAAEMREELLGFKELIRFITFSVRIPQDKPVIVVTHQLYMLALEPLFHLGRVSTIKECEGYLLGLSDQRDSVISMEFIHPE